MKPAKPRPYVIIEVYGGVADVTLTVAGQGTPAVYIVDWDNQDCPEIPEWLLNEYQAINGRKLEA